MIIDSSALLAVLFREEDSGKFLEAMKQADTLRMSAASWFEAAMAVDRCGDAIARNRFDQIIELMGIELHPLTAEHVAHARHAWHTFGPGSARPAKLNFGDCLTYGLAKARGESLLFKDRDFAQTDIEPALRN